jgi:hypothetical protein
MLTDNDVSEVRTYNTAAGRTLSVYLDVDQSKTINLYRGFERSFESKIQQIDKMFGDECERRNFTECLADVRNLLSTYEPHGRGLMILAKSAAPIWFRELNVPVTTEVRWSDKAHVQPFVEALDEFKTYAVAITDRARARIFTVWLASMEKHADIYTLEGVRHMKTTGTDHLYSQSGNQRKNDEHSLSHLKRVVGLLESTAKRRPFNHLVLAGTIETTSELFRLLPKSLCRKVVASTVIASNATEHEILRETLAIEHRVERSEEINKVEELITLAAKGHGAVIALSDTLEALNENRVRELVYAEGFEATGTLCDNCHKLFAGDENYCEACALPVSRTVGMPESAITWALAQGSSIEQVKGDAADKLRTVGGIGAFLRF